MTHTHKMMNHTTDANRSGEIEGLVFDFPFSGATRVALLCVWVVLSVLGTVGNILVIAIILKVKFLRTRLNMMILNLAVVDLLFVIFNGPPLIVTFANEAYPVSEVWCGGLLAVSRFLLMAETCNISLIALTRYLKVCQTNTYDKYFTKRGTAFTCMAVWALGLLTNVNAAINPETVIFNSAWQMCFVDGAKSMRSKYVFFLGLLPQYMLTSYFYVNIIKVIRKSRRKMNSFRNNVFRNLKNTSNRSEILSNIVVFSLYVFLPMPFLLQSLFNLNIPHVVEALMLVCLGLNSSINCIVYGFMNKNVMRCYRQVLPSVWFIQRRTSHQLQARA